MNVKLKRITFAILLFPAFTGCSNSESVQSNMEKETIIPATADTTTLGAGCFWCTEAVYQQLNGVISVTSGYSGGQSKNPSYREVCSGITGHAEVAQIIFDTTKITFTELLEVFWTAHDPTTLNRQGADQGTQYRSVIFYNNEKQKEIAEAYKKKLNDERAFPNPVVTEISPFTVFYKAEDYHMDYFDKNGNAPYCQMVIAPKVDKVRKIFKDKLKK